MFKFLIKYDEAGSITGYDRFPIQGTMQGLHVEVTEDNFVFLENLGFGGVKDRYKIENGILVEKNTA